MITCQLSKIFAFIVLVFNTSDSLKVDFKNKIIDAMEGEIKLVGGRNEFEGNVEIYHNGQWGAICDDEWDTNEATVVCRQLGYKEGNFKPTHNSYFGHSKYKYWMDNLYCDESEKEITSCRFNGWENSDCDSTEFAGVVCQEPIKKGKLRSDILESTLETMPNVEVRLQGSQVPGEGRVEVKSSSGTWETICGNGWSLLEAFIVCRSLSLGYASKALQTVSFGGAVTNSTYSGVKCFGEETTLSQCMHDASSRGFCRGSNLAAIQCTETLPDLVIDDLEIMNTALVEDREMFYLQCSMEENCLGSQAYRIKREDPEWYNKTRRLLKFTAKISNFGMIDFQPTTSRDQWTWHMCHMHYHSVEVLATYNLYDNQGIRVSEGHKASFCLEDNECLSGVQKKYDCSNYGDQGISVNCSDIYNYKVDCQWIDISEIEYGLYTLKVIVNPDFKMAELSFENNCAICQFNYTENFKAVTNCSLQRP